MKPCIFCKKEYDETDSTTEYCSYCGAPLRNRCSDYSCGYDLDDDACFCKYCGSPSTFYNAGILTPEKIFKSKETVAPIFFVEDELPFN